MTSSSVRFAIIGTGFVADLYMRSFKRHDQISVQCAFDIDHERLNIFCKFWNVRPVYSLSELFEATDPKTVLILNLTNPSSHYEVSLACLKAGFNVYSEKPLATKLHEAKELVVLADSLGLNIGSAPCSVLGQTAQTLLKAIRQQVIGKARLVYAELDDSFVFLAPYEKWVSDSGAPWPSTDEFSTGCTLEHAGYFLTWLIAIFGSIVRVTASSHAIAVKEFRPDIHPAPDYSVATLVFQSGIVARLTCSIIASHNHQLRIFGDDGILEVKECWNNSEPVRLRKRLKLRRRLVELPWSKKLDLVGTSRKGQKWGAASMDFALGPLEMMHAANESRLSLINSSFALHLTEVTLAIQNSGSLGACIAIESRCEPFGSGP